MSVDLLNPLATLTWKKKVFEGVLPTTFPHPRMRSDTLLFKGRLSVVITYKDYDRNRKSSLCFFDFCSWKMLPPLPCISPGLSTYHSQLALVGGEPPYGNKVLVSEDDGSSWIDSSLPTMPTDRKYPSVANTGTSECLVVAGGMENKPMCYTTCKAVEVLMEEQWWTVASPPYVGDPNLLTINLSLDSGNLYACGNKDIFYCSVQALIASCTASNNAVKSDLWVAGWHCGNTANNNLMISFQRKLFYFSTTYKSPNYLRSMHVIHNQSVVAIGTSVDGEAPDSNGCTHLLPGGNLSILDCTASAFVLYTPSIKVSSYDPDGQFNWSALSKLQAAGIEVITALYEVKDQDPTSSQLKDDECTHDHGLCKSYKDFLKDVHWISAVEKTDFFKWASSKIVPQTWQSLYNVLGKLDYGMELSEQIESHLLSMGSLKELCASVIMQALLEKELDPQQLPARLPDYVPPTLKRSITHKYSTAVYVTL